MSQSKQKVKKAQPKELKEAWLTLSEAKADFEKRICLADLFKTVRGELSREEVVNLWQLLVKYGYYLHPSLESQYNKQRNCIWCGGAVILFETPDVGKEERCSNCGYLYIEE